MRRIEALTGRRPLKEVGAALHLPGRIGPQRRLDLGSTASATPVAKESVAVEHEARPIDSLKDGQLRLD